jgi:hypothetical protein
MAPTEIGPMGPREQLNGAGVRMDEIRLKKQNIFQMTILATSVQKISSLKFGNSKNKKMVGPYSLNQIL